MFKFTIFIIRATSFIKIPINRLKRFYRFLKQLDLEKRILPVTGGGAVKYQQHIEGLGLECHREDEIASVVKGVNFMRLSWPLSFFVYHWRTKTRQISERTVSLPYLLVSIISVEGEDKYKRLTGTSIGGGTFWALCSLLTNVKDFDQIEHYSKIGDNKEVDLLVSDIYGGDYQDANLKGHVIASNLAKITTCQSKTDKLSSS